MPKPSKRLIILAECVWASEEERSLVLKELCERMACDQLDRPFWVGQYLISPVAQTSEGGGADGCVQYKIHISSPKVEPGAPVETEVGGTYPGHVTPGLPLPSNSVACLCRSGGADQRPGPSSRRPLRTGSGRWSLKRRSIWKTSSREAESKQRRRRPQTLTSDRK